MAQVPATSARMMTGAFTAIAWMFSDAWNNPAAVGTVERPNPVGRRLVIGTEAGEYEFVYTAPVPKSVAELALRMQAAFPHVLVKVLAPSYYSTGMPAGSEYITPTLSADGKYQPAFTVGAAIVFETIAAGSNAVIYVGSGSSLGPLLGGLVEGISQVRGSDQHTSSAGYYPPNPNALANAANMPAAIAALVSHPTIHAIKESYQGILATLGSYVHQADTLYQQAKVEATSAIDARIAVFRAQILPTYRRINRFDNVANGALVFNGLPIGVNTPQDVATVFVPKAKAGDDLAITVTGVAQTAGNSGSVDVIVVESYDTPAANMRTIQGGEQAIALDAKERIGIHVRLPVTLDGNAAVYVRAKVKTNLGSITPSTVRLDVTHDGVVSF